MTTSAPRPGSCASRRAKGKAMPHIRTHAPSSLPPLEVQRAAQGHRAREGPVLSHQVRALIGEGNHAYVDGDTAGAIRAMQEVIRIEPRAASAWSVLATCYRDMHEPVKALQLAVMGAHLRHDPEEWEHLAAQSRELGFSQQALYCYGKVVGLDPANVNALWERASLGQEIGDLKKVRGPAFPYSSPVAHIFLQARHAYLGILKRYLHDLNVLSELRHILVELSDLRLCTTLFQRAFTHYTSAPPPPNGGGFGAMEIFVLADLYNSLGEHNRAIDVTRAGHRWLHGRAEQHFWDTCPDDREFDPEGVVRDDSTVRFQQGFYALDVNARHRLAIARLKLGEISEGRVRPSFVLRSFSALLWRRVR